MAVLIAKQGAFVYYDITSYDNSQDNIKSLGENYGKP